MIQIKPPCRDAPNIKMIFKEHAMYTRILVPVDGSATFNKALAAALQWLAKPAGASG